MAYLSFSGGPRAPGNLRKAVHRHPFNLTDVPICTQTVLVRGAGEGEAVASVRREAFRRGGEGVGAGRLQTIPALDVGDL